jgi:parallel beta-helix repeat protein
MKTILSWLLALATASFFIGMIPHNAVAQTTITVPDDYTTIQQAINGAVPGDKVYVRSGTYYEHVTINKSLTLQGEDRENTIIDGGGSGKVVTVTSTSNVTVSGLTIRNSGNSTAIPQAAGIVLYYASHSLIRECIITSNGLNGLYANQSWYTTIQNCDISYNEPDSIQDGEIRGAIHLRSSLNSAITGNNIYENKGIGITVRGYSDNVTIAGNHVYSNTSDGIHLGWSNSSLVRNNITHDNNGSGIHLDSTYYCTVRNNDVYLNGGGIYVGYAGRYNTIRDNIVHYNTVGISMGGPSVYGNKIWVFSLPSG